MATSGSLKTNAYNGRYYLFEWSASQNIADNTSTISWSLKAVGGNSAYYAERTLQVIAGGATRYSKTDRVERYTGTIKSGSFTVAHNDAGEATFTASIKAAVYVSSVNLTASGTFTLNSIPRKSALTVTNGVLGEAQTLSITRKSTDFTHTIIASCGDATTTICSKSSKESISFTPPLSWAAANTTGTTVSVTYKITTYNGNTAVDTSSITTTCEIPDSVIPTCQITLTDPTGYESIYGGFLKGLSKFKITVAGTPIYGSEIVGYKVTANGSTYTKSPVTTSTIAKSGNNVIEASVTDKRGHVGRTSLTVNVLNYTAPKITKLNVGRCNADGSDNDQGSYVKITYSYNVVSLNDVNKVSVKIKYKRADATNYTTHSVSSSSNQYNLSNQTHIFEADSSSSYDVLIEVKDNFKTTTLATSVSTAFTIMHFKDDGRGIGFGKLAEESDLFDVGFAIRFTGGIKQYVLPNGLDMNNLKLPNTYSGNEASTSKYMNIPITKGTFVLTVTSHGSEDGVKQRLELCDKTNPKAWERIFDGSWGQWVCVSDFGGTLLWSGGSPMGGNVSFTMAETVAKQRNGIVLVFSEYNNGTVDSSFHTFFVHKHTVANHDGRGHTFHMSTFTASIYAVKYLYITNTKVSGHANNNTPAAAGASGLTLTNNRFCLRYVIGV